MGVSSRVGSAGPCAFTINPAQLLQRVECSSILPSVTRLVPTVVNHDVPTKTLHPAQSQMCLLVSFARGFY